ncbi:MAG: putative Mg2+ transporter-C (MgtC) family protein [Patescibacteria group bacterium]|jgi:putative Mg2+ transporter-C (MgtC) family protein|nr:MgtC/SapB family protein [Candidatus Paceibacterota bacterium]MDQ5927799.1 putative Mg2+ transporter-C (MgtC) family protein [Patescibacteria group bacterium]
MELELIQTMLPVVVALLLGMLIGVERSLAHKTAGLRTYGLVAMGSALFIVVARMGGDPNAVQYADSIMRITAAVVTGIGFLCAGAIILRDKMVVGLTTAAGLWIAAGIGVAAGFELYALAVLTTFLTLLTFTIFWYLERGVQEISE